MQRVGCFLAGHDGEENTAAEYGSMNPAASPASSQRSPASLLFRYEKSAATEQASRARQHASLLITGWSAMIAREIPRASDFACLKTAESSTTPMLIALTQRDHPEPAIMRTDQPRQGSVDARLARHASLCAKIETFCRCS